MRWWCAIALVCGACKGGSDNNGAPQTVLKPSLDLTGVIGFAIANPASMRDSAAPASGVDAGTCMPSTLFALQADGTMVVTTVTEYKKKDMTQCSSMTTSEMASAVFDTGKYAVITYQSALEDCSSPGVDGGTCQQCSYVVLRKSDGALFCGADQIFQFAAVRGDADTLWLDGNGSSGDVLLRLDMSVDPPSATTVDDASKTGDHVSAIDVDAANNAFVDGGFGARIYKASGGLQNISARQASFQWLDTGGDFGYSAQAATGLAFETYRLAPGTYTPALAGTFTSGLGVPMLALATPTQVYGLEYPSAGVPAIVDLTPSAAGGVCNDQYNVPIIGCTDDTPCTGTCAGICQGGPNAGLTCQNDAFCTTQCQLSGATHAIVNGPPVVHSIVAAGTELYLQAADSSGNGMILGIDASTIQETACATGMGVCTPGQCCSAPVTPKTLLAAGDYTVTAISLSRTGELTFAGLRNSDGARVIGNCSGGACTVLNASAPDVTVLQRIN